MAERILWNEYETALLIEAFWKIEANHHCRTFILKQLSKDLRQMAINQGKIIDEIYRNYNGMCYMLNSILTAFYPQKGTIHSSKLFNKIANLYLFDKEKYYLLLKQAHAMADKENGEMIQDNKNAFTNWLNKQNLKKMSITNLIDTFDLISEYTQIHAISKMSIWDIDNYKQFNQIRSKVSGDKIFKLSNKTAFIIFEKYGKLYTQFLNEKQNIPIISTKTSFEIEKSISNNDVKQNNKNIENKSLQSTISLSESVDKHSSNKTDVSSNDSDLFVQPLIINREEGFTIWLKENNISPLLSNIYISKLHYISDLCLRKEYSNKPLFEINNDKELTNISSQLFTDTEFVDNNTKQYNILTLVFSKYNKFIRQSILKISKPVEIKHDIKTKPKINSNRKIINEKIDFSSIPSLHFTKPQSMKYYNKEFAISSWRDLFVSIGSILLEDYPEIIKHVAEDKEYVFISNEKSLLRFPMNTFENIYLEGNLNANDIIKCIKKLLDICNIDYDNISIIYSSKSIKNESYNTNIIKTIEKPNKIEINCTEQLKILLEKKFKYGFGLNVPLDMTRLQNYAESYGIELSSNEEIVKLQICSCGLRIDDRVYFFSNYLYEDIKLKIDEVFNKGYSVIFYDMFIKNNQEWAETNYIFDEKILKGLITKCTNKIYCGKTCFIKGEKTTEAEAVIKEIKHVTKDSLMVAIEDLVLLLPYISENKIKQCLSSEKDYVRNESNIYVNISQIVYSEEEKQRFCNFIENKCAQNGYVAISEIPIESLMETNDLLSANAIHHALFNLFLSENYYIKGKIITKEKTGVDILTLTKDFCINKEQCTIDEIMDYVEDIVGEDSRRYAIEGAYATMVRINENTFISDKLINFDVDKIDKLINSYLKSKFNSITSIAVFTLFPSCGVGWNHYILESYVNRFSRKYRLSLYNFNDKNAGIIVKKSCDLSYIELLAEEIIRKNIPCNKEEIGIYLFNNGFTAKSKMALYDKVIEIINTKKGA